MEKIISTSSTFLKVLLVISLLGFIVTVNAKEKTVGFIGSSMEPTLIEGYRLIIKYDDFDNIKEGSLVIYRNQFTGTRTVHRAIKKQNYYLGLSKKWGWLMKGDNNKRYDRGLVSERVYIATVIGHINLEGEKTYYEQR